jgi:hypothetical protein
MRSLIFTLVKPLVLISFLTLLILNGLPMQSAAQVSGLVMDIDTRHRLGRVFIYNPTNDEGVFNNARGEFTIDAQPGDLLIAAVESFFVDTIRVPDSKVVIFTLKRSSILLPEVSVVMIQSPEDRLKANMEKFSSAYRKGAKGDYFSVGPTGAGLNIDAIYNLFSKEAKNARKLQSIIEEDYKQSVIDYKFSKELIQRLTGLTGKSLDDFMQQYRPSYEFIAHANEYQIAQYIQKQLSQYRLHPGARRLPPLSERFKNPSN